MFTPSHPRIYDTIGTGYSDRRVPDVRIAAAIRAALDGCKTVCNIGAGTGSYEPMDLEVTAVEPSAKMIEQRSSSFPVVQASAENLPFKEGTFDGAMSVLSVHHWLDMEKGLREMKRVSHRQVLFTFDPGMADSFWLVRDYFPEFMRFDIERFVDLETLSKWLDVLEIQTVHIPWDCTDGFQAAYWRRPEYYLIPQVRQAISTFAQVPQSLVDLGIKRLANDIESGVWHERYAHLLAVDEMDFGYRLIIAGERK